MGYRHYFYKVSKDMVEKVKNMTIDEINEYAKSCDCYYECDITLYKDKFLDKKEIFEFGKVRDDLVDRIEKFGEPLFADSKTQDYLNYYDPYIIRKEGLVEAINIYTEKVQNYYEDLLKADDVFEALTSINKITDEVKGKIFEISNFGIINTEEDCDYLTDSWLYEYSIFNLGYILKTFDFDKDCLLLFGW